MREIKLFSLPVLTSFHAYTTIQIFTSKTIQIKFSPQSDYIHCLLIIITYYYYLLPPPLRKTLFPAGLQYITYYILLLLYYYIKYLKV
jgi:hypothetical protein